jgi:transposase
VQDLFQVKLARSYRSGDLTPVWVPDAEQEALRDLVRARESAKKDQLRARHRLCSRYRRLLARGTLKQEAITAVGRELWGFIWAVGIQVEKEQQLRRARAA